VFGGQLYTVTLVDSEPMRKVIAFRAIYDVSCITQLSPLALSTLKNGASMTGYHDILLICPRKRVETY